MIALPRYLKPWAPELEIFPYELAIVIGNLAAHLAALLGAGPSHVARDGELDGVGGIARRGSYQRLLTTEWLIAQDFPDEFVRRAVSMEHSFLELAHRDKGGRARTVVLFDSGPEQLGAPRIVHLALLVLFARRARARDIELEWGVLQDKSTTLHGALSEAMVISLLASRSMERVRDAELERWKSALGSFPRSELWLIGGETLARGISDAYRVRIGDVLDLGTPRKLRVQVENPQGGARELCLPVPEDRIAVRLLRNPFEHARSNVPLGKGIPAIDPRSNIRFTSHGRRVHVRGEGQTLLTFPVTQGGQVKPRVFRAPEGHVIIGVGEQYQDHRAIVLTHARDRIVVHCLSKRGNQVISRIEYRASDGYTLPEPNPNAWLGPVAAFGPSRFQLVLVPSWSSSQGNIVELDGNEVRPRDAVLMKFDPRVIRTDSKDQLFYLSELGGFRCVSNGVATRWSVPDRVSLRILYNNSQVAYQTDLRTWLVADSEVKVPQGSIVGLIWDELVHLDEARHSLSLVGPRNRREPLMGESSPITHVTVEDGRMAYLTEAGVLTIYSLSRHAVAFRIGGSA